MNSTLQAKYDAARKPSAYAYPDPSEIEPKIPVGEKVLQVLFGTGLDVGANTATLVLTDKAIHAFTKKPLLKKIGSTQEVIPFRQITGITRQKKVLAKWILEISRADNTDSYAYLDEMESQAFYVAAQELMSNQSSEGVGTSSAVVDNPLQQLSQLKELFDSGVISQAEFEDKKAVLLGRI